MVRYTAFDALNDAQLLERVVPIAWAQSSVMFDPYQERGEVEERLDLTRPLAFANGLLAARSLWLPGTTEWLREQLTGPAAPPDFFTTSPETRRDHLPSLERVWTRLSLEWDRMEWERTAAAFVRLRPNPRYVRRWVLRHAHTPPGAALDSLRTEGISLELALVEFSYHAMATEGLAFDDRPGIAPDKLRGPAEPWVRSSLHRAAQNYDLLRGYSFLTYAKWWVARGLELYQANPSRPPSSWL